MSQPKYPDVVVPLVGEEGNAFAIIGRVREAIRKEVGKDEANAFVKEALASESYDALLVLVMSYVEVE